MHFSVIFAAFMSLFIASLNSGSNGNCYYVGNGKEAVLIDAGISCRETERRLKRLGLSIKNVMAVFISHEHTDHIRGMEALAARHYLPIYITAPTLENSRARMGQSYVKMFRPFEPVQIGDLTVHAFPKHHDAIDPYSFVVEGNGVRIGVFTDIGTTCEHLVSHFSQCHAAFLEANYDEAMLETGPYPIHLKKRIRGGKGHLSNREALELFMNHRPPFMSHLLLSHISKNNNTPALVSETFSQFSDELNIIVASRYKESPVYEVGSTFVKAEQPLPTMQATLF